jgi:hypothetical protein
LRSLLYYTCVSYGSAESYHSRAFHFFKVGYRRARDRRTGITEKWCVCASLDTLHFLPNCNIEPFTPHDEAAIEAEQAAEMQKEQDMFNRGKACEQQQSGGSGATGT